MRLFDLFAGERVVVGAIRKRKGHGFLALADADRIAVDIEQAHALEQLAAGTRNTTLKILAGHSVVDHDSKVVLNGRVLRELTVVLLVAGALDQLVQVELKGNDDLVNAHSLARLGVDLANPAQHGTAREHLGSTTRLQEGITLALDGTEANLLDAQLGKQLLNDALAKEETQLAVLHGPRLLAPLAREHARHGLGLLGQAGVLATVEQAADLVQVHVERAVGLVVGHRLQQTRQQRAAHLGLLGHQRVHENHGAAAALGGHANLLQVARGGKAKGRGLVEATGAQDLADLAGKLLLARQTADVVLGSRNGRRDATHAP